MRVEMRRGCDGDAQLVGSKHRTKLKMEVRAIAVVLFCVAALLFLQQKASPAESGAAPTFYRDVLPILQNHCQSCHRADEIGMMPLVSYEQARPFAKAIAASVSQKKM